MSTSDELKNAVQTLKDLEVAAKYEKKFEGDLSDDELASKLAENMSEDPIPPLQHQEAADRSKLGLSNATPLVTGSHEFLTVTIQLYAAEKSDPYNPDWLEFKRYQEQGWEIAEKEESPSLTLVRKLSRVRRGYGS